MTAYNAVVDEGTCLALMTPKTMLSTCCWVREVPSDREPPLYCTHPPKAIVVAPGPEASL